MEGEGKRGTGECREKDGVGVRKLRYRWGCEGVTPIEKDSVGVRGPQRGGTWRIQLWNTN